MAIEGTSGPPRPDAEGPTNGEDRSGLSKRARVVILVVALGGLLLLGLVVSQRNRDAYDRAMTRVQVSAHAAGDTIDVDTFWSAWVLETTGQSNGVEDRPARELVPELDGAELVSYRVVGPPNPTQVLIDYQVDAGNQEGCVLIHRSNEGTTVSTFDDVCTKAFQGAP